MFMFGPGPLRRTLKYLESGKLLLKNHVRIMEVHYNLHGKMYQTPEQQRKDIFNGMREFYFWETPRIQHQNHHLQIVRHLNKMPTPFIRCWLEDGRDVLFDCYRHSREEILERLMKTLGKSTERIKLENEIASEVGAKDNSALFGWERERYCMCECVGQSPCPGTIRNERFDDIEVKL